jgi:hypothetical protein
MGVVDAATVTIQIDGNGVNVTAMRPPYIPCVIGDVVEVLVGSNRLYIFGWASEILPKYPIFESIGAATTSGSYTDLSIGAVSVSAVISGSGSAKVSVGAYMGVGGIAGSQAGGFVGVSIDGNAPASPLDEILYYSISSGAGDGIAGTQSAIAIVSLTPGPHTFTMKFKTANGGSVTFGSLSLIIEPF